jgi:hypothetical protein
MVWQSKKFAQTPLNNLETKNQHAPINLIPLRNATLYNTTLRYLVARCFRGAADVYVIDAADIKDYSSKGQVAEHPSEDDGRAETLIIVFVLILRGDVALRCLPLGLEGAELGLVLSVKICIVGGNGDLDFATWLEGYGGEFLGFVVTFCAPGDIVGVTESVHVQNVDISRSKKEVLQETGYHVPRVEEENRRKEVE